MGFLPPLDVLVRLPLAPWMLFKGLRIKRKALILPEAAGPREGCSGKGSDLRVLIVGDSSGAGVGVADQKDALSGQLVAALEKTHRVGWKLVAKTGATTKSATVLLGSEPSTAYDVAVLALGVNDVAQLLFVSRWRARQSQLRNQLRARFKVRKIFVTAVPPLQHFPVLPSLLQWVLGAHAARMNDALQEDIVNDADTHLVTIDLPFTPDAMASDGFHPSARTYALWGQIMADEITRTDIACHKIRS